MYELIRRLSLKQLTFEQLPVLLLALTIAEVFYKFHSFLLETGAFLVTCERHVHAALHQRSARRLGGVDGRL